MNLLLKTKVLCKKILELGGIIAGGFVNSLINPTFREVNYEELND